MINVLMLLAARKVATQSDIFYEGGNVSPSWNGPNHLLHKKTAIKALLSEKNCKHHHTYKNYIHNLTIYKLSF